MYYTSHSAYVDSKNVSEKFRHPSVLKNKKGVFFSNKFYFPEIFFFRHFSKSCSVFYILKTKFFFGKIIFF